MKDRAYDPAIIGKRPEQRRPATEGGSLRGARRRGRLCWSVLLMMIWSRHTTRAGGQGRPRAPGAPISRLAAAPSGGLLGCASTDGRVVVVDHRARTQGAAT